MMKQALTALLVAVCAVPGVHAQGPGAANQEKRRDERGAWTGIPHVIPHVPSALPHSGVPNVNPASDLHFPKLTPPEVAFPPVPKFKFPVAEFSPAMGEATAIARGLSSAKGGGILAGIGGGLAALGGLFGRKKES